MSLILKHLVFFIDVVFAYISASLSSFNVEVFLFFDAFSLFLVVFFLTFITHFYIKRKKNSEKK